jgi:hypothetical protein
MDEAGPISEQPPIDSKRAPKLPPGVSSINQSGRRPKLAAEADPVSDAPSEQPLNDSKRGPKLPPGVSSINQSGRKPKLAGEADPIADAPSQQPAARSNPRAKKLAGDVSSINDSGKRPKLASVTHVDPIADSFGDEPIEHSENVSSNQLHDFGKASGLPPVSEVGPLAGNLWGQPLGQSDSEPRKVATPIPTGIDFLNDSGKRPESPAVSEVDPLADNLWGQPVGQSESEPRKVTTPIPEPIDSLDDSGKEPDDPIADTLSGEPYRESTPVPRRVATPFISLSASGQESELPPIDEVDPISGTFSEQLYGEPPMVATPISDTLSEEQSHEDPLTVNFEAQSDDLSVPPGEDTPGVVPEPKKPVGKAPRRPRRIVPQKEDAPDPFEAALASLGISDNGPSPAAVEESQPKDEGVEPNRPSFIDQLMQNIAAGSPEEPNVDSDNTIDFPEAYSGQEQPVKMSPVLQRRVAMKEDRELTFYRLCERDPSSQPIE